MFVFCPTNTWFLWQLLGESFRVSLMQLFLVELSFKASLILGSLWVEYWTWCVSGRTHALERSHWTAQKSKPMRPLSWGISPATDSCCCSLVVSRLWAGVSAGCRQWELFLLAGDKGVDIKAESQTHCLCLHLRFCFLILILLRKWEHLPERLEHPEMYISTLYFLTELFRSFSWGENTILRIKLLILILISP